MKKVTFDTPVTFYIKDSEHYRRARQSDWQREQADKRRFMDRVKAFEKLFTLLKWKE